MELLLTNGQKVVTMDYAYVDGSGADFDAKYTRQNTYITSLWRGSAGQLPNGHLEYNFANGGKIVFEPNPVNTSYIIATIHDKNGNQTGGTSTQQAGLWYLTYNNFNSGAYTGGIDSPQYGKPTIGIYFYVGAVNDVPQQTENNQPIMVEMVGRGDIFNNPEDKANGTGVCYESTNENYIAIADGSDVPSDPYFPGGSTEPGGGTGSFDDKGELIGIPGLPTLSAVSAGFITLFNPTIPQLKNLASYMWSDLFDVAGWKKIFADPMDAILGLSIVPVAVPSPKTQEVKVGNISTGVQMSVAESQYVEVDCGTLNVEEFWGSYLDYAPYTKAEIYLPYCGIHPISVDDIMAKAVRVVYHVDILSGACCAFVECGGTVLYSFVGQCSSSIPITGDNWTNVINGAISVAGAIGTMISSGGASAPMAIGQIASTAVNTMKPSIEKSGSMGGTGGMLGVQKPYLILSRPRQALPSNQNTFSGYPSFITEKLGDLSGYTEIDSIHLENVPATESELSEIESLLKGGVIF